MISDQKTRGQNIYIFFKWLVIIICIYSFTFGFYTDLWLLYFEAQMLNVSSWHLCVFIFYGLFFPCLYTVLAYSSSIMWAIPFSLKRLFSHFSCVYLLKAVMKSLMWNGGTRLVAVCHGSFTVSSHTLRCPFTSVFCWLATPFASLGWTAWWDW